MPVRKLKIPPTWVNDAYINGPLYHYRRITDSQLRELGIEFSPGKSAGNVVRKDGITARRLRDGRLNVIVSSSAGILRDPAFNSFVAAVLSPVPVTDRDLDLDDPRVERGGPAIEVPAKDASFIGVWEWLIVAGKVSLSPGACDAFGIRHDGSVKMAEDEFMRLVRPADHDAAMRQLRSAANSLSQYESTYDRKGMRTTLAGTFVRDGMGRAVRMVGVVKSFTLQRQVS